MTHLLHANQLKRIELSSCNNLISVELDIFDDDQLDIELTDCPFAHCKIMQLGHSSMFTKNSSMHRDFNLKGDEIIDGHSDAWRTFWLPLEPTDNWHTIVFKADVLARMSGDNHHTRLECFSVVGDILIPEFGS